MEIGSSKPEAGGRTMKVRNFEELDVWQAAHRLTLDVYKITSSLPQSEMYGLASQMRRAAVSVPSNIAEGFGRIGKKEKLQFYNIAQGSLSELRYDFILAKDLGYIKENTKEMELSQHIARMLQSIMKRTSERQ
jgi:four helix bundle protein